MTPERWHQIEPLFDAALQYTAAERNAFLNQACADDPELRRDVEHLLDAAEDADAYFDELAHRVGVPGPAASASAMLSPPEPSFEGHHFVSTGFYRIDREVGRGGMGTVYLAHRTDAEGHLEQRIALKVIKRGMDTDLVLQRFLRERQILARLQHPNIARFYDAGLTDDGRPYVAMEYVDGVSLTDYCDARQFGVEARLRLFQAVCEAVHYAHRNLVVHRDLKPSNIMVIDPGTGPEQARVKLLDFGIAKLLSDDEDEAEVTLTKTDMQVMTPAYAAPEQVQGAAITTATDVYALGVVLYELLTGHRPIHVAGRSTEEMVAAILNEQPERPSSAIGQPVERTRADGTMETVPPEVLSQARGTHVERLRRHLTGDLDTICLMALKKEPERRYASVEAFLEDIKRHLAGLPVTAERDTTGYRLRKFIGRHKIGVAAALVALLSLMTGFTVALWQASVARNERNEKQIEATRANVTRDYVLSLFESLDPYEAQGRRFTAYELIGPGIQRLESLKGQPLERAAVMRVLGDVCVSAGLLSTADSLFAEALAIQQTHLAPGNPDIAATLEGRASVHLLLHAYHEAQLMLEQALAIRENTLGRDHPQLLKTLNQLAYLHAFQNNLKEAETHYRRALSLGDRASGSLRSEVARSLRGRADVYVKRGRPEDAMPLLHEALALYEQTLGTSHTETGRTLYSLAQALKNTGDFAQADSLLQRALRINERVYGAQHYCTATVRYELGLLKEAAEDFEEARRYFEEAAAIYDRVLPDTHLYKAYPFREMGLMLLVAQQRPAEAEAPLRRAFAIYQKALPATHLTLLQTRLELAGCLFRLGQYEEADALLRENYEVLSARTDTTSAATDVMAQTLRGLVRIAEIRGHPATAAPFRTALQALSTGE